MTRNSKDIRRAYSDPDDLARLAWVYRDLANHGQSLALLMRYEGALNRSYDRAFKQLHMLQSARRRSQPNEPKRDPLPALAPAAVTPNVVSPIPPPSASDMASDDPSHPMSPAASASDSQCGSDVAQLPRLDSSV